MTTNREDMTMTTTCPNCHGAGTEMSGTTHAGLAEHLACDECGPDCPQDCGCRVDDAAEHPEFVAGDGLGATQSQDGSPSATERLRGSEGAIGKAEVIDLGAVIADIERHREHTPRSDRSPARSCPTCEPETLPNASDVRPVSPARDAVTLDYDEASRVPALLADKAALMGERDRLSGLLAESERDLSRALDERDAARDELDKYLVLAPQTCPLGEHEEWLVDSEHLHPCPWCERDRARGTAATLEAENARLTEALYLTRITLEATFRVLQEASGLPDDIDDPDCRDEMVLALRPRAEKAEAENARLREGIEALAAKWHQAYDPDPIVLTNRMRAADLRALLAEGGE